MTQLTIVTTPPNSGDGTPLATAFNYCNSNFSELYSRVQTTPPASLVGSTGDTAGMYAYDQTYFYYCYADYDGTSTIWGQVTQVGNVSVSSISSGTSNVKIVDVNGNATTSIAGTANVVVVANTGQYVSGVVSASGNITGSYILGNGSQLSGLPQSYSNANVAAYLPTYSGDITANNVSVTTGVNANGIVSATGNIVTAGFFIGNFQGNLVGNLTNIPGPNGAVVFNDGAGNAAATAGLVFDNSGPNVLTVLGSFSATQGITATGNITGGNLSATNIVGNITTASQTNITSVGTLVSLSVSGNVQAGNLRTAGQITATGNITTAGYLAVTQDINAGGDITATSYTGNTMSLLGNITGGNILTGGRISAVGNITGNFIIGNGSQLTGLITNTIQNGNSNVLIGSSAGNISINVNGISPVMIATPLGIAVTGTTSTSGNLSAGNILTAGFISATSTILASANITGGNLLTPGSISATSTITSAANISGGNVLTGGSVSASGTVTGNAITGNAITGTSLTVSTGTVTCGNIVNSNSNGVGNIGSASTYYNTLFATATLARYADLAENYTADADYAPGTVVEFGGSAEITQCNHDMSSTVVGVISTQPAYLMNSGLAGDHVAAVALMGRVPCQVQGPVTRGALMVSAGNGRARAESAPLPGTIIGKAVQSFEGLIGTIEILVGRV